jgi:zinc/manganese transport system ATP-binding protein
VIRQARLELDPEPIEMTDQLTPQRPSGRPGRRRGRQVLAEPVLPIVRRGQMTIQIGLQYVVGMRIQLAEDRGEQQRVLIAQAVISRPRLLLLDEPLANLDLRSEQGIVSVLARLAQQQGIAVLISAHDMNPLMAETDRIVYVAAGKAAAGRDG